jgi:hypothetical protein
VDLAINTVNGYPELLRCDRVQGVPSRPGSESGEHSPASGPNHWIKVRTIGTKSNRSGIGARIKCTAGSRRQIDEVRSGGSSLPRAICASTLA